MSNKLISEEQMAAVLDKCYLSAVNGLPGSKPCDELAKEYLSRNTDLETAAHKFIKAQVTKCSASGFVTSLGGAITLPVGIPANIASVLYVQIRMIATLAVMGGKNLQDDEVQTLVYLCLVKSSITDVCKSAGVQVANKVTLNLLKKLPGEVLKKINQKVGFRLVTKFGEKGVVNLVKMVPLAGGLMGGGFDLVTTKSIANKAYKVFCLDEID